MPKLIILRGPSGSGKSTYRNQLIKNSNEFIGYVNKDEIRAMKPEAKEKEVHGTQLYMMGKFAELNCDIIIDNTNLVDRTVEGYKNWAKQHRYEVELVDFFGVSWEECIKRDRLRIQNGTSVGRSVIIQQFMKVGKFSDRRRKTIIVDIDGTTSDPTHRRHYVTLNEERTRKDWKSWNENMHLDPVNPAVKLILDHFKDDMDYDIIFCSGRSEDYRKETEKWLCENGFCWYHLLLMRPWNTSEVDYLVKQELFMNYIAGYYDVEFVLDDRSSVVEMWRTLGLTCLQVAEGDF